MLKKMVMSGLVCTLSVLCFSLPAARAENMISNGSFSAGLQGWTVVPTEPPPWPLVDGAVNLHPPSGGYTGTVIYQVLSVTGVGGKTYNFSMKLLKTGTPDGSWRTVAVYLTYTDNGAPVRYKLANPLNSEIATQVSPGPPDPVFSVTVTASYTLPTTATAITKIEFAKENFGDFTVDDIVLMQGAAACTFTIAKTGSFLQGGVIPGSAAYLGPAAGAATLNITASDAACVWNASVPSGSGDWLTITGSASGTGNGTIQVNAAANPDTTGIPRYASISLGSAQSYPIWQLSAALPRSVVSLGALNSRRAGNHTATMLQNGKVLIAGGHTNVNTTDVLATAELYDQTARTFTLTGSMNVPRWGHTANLLPDGKVLIAGGYNYQGSVHTNLDSAELYDPATGQFTLLTSRMGSPRRQHTATPFTDPISKARKILIAGGINSGGAAQTDTWTVTNTADLYDVATATFTPTGNLITGRGTHRATTIPGGSVTVLGVTVTLTNILIAAGSSFNSYLTSAEIYDTGTGTFSATGAMATGRAHGVGSFSTVFGGGITDGQTCLASTEFYNPTIGGFSPYATLNQARRGHRVVQLSVGQVLVSGGDCAGNPTMEILDLATDTFTNTSTPMTTARVFHTATPLYGSSPEIDILIVGGDPAGTAELYAYTRPAGFTLTLQKAGAGSGTVSGSGLACSGTTCTGSYAAGTPVTLTATADTGSTFSGWGGGGCSGTGNCSLIMSSDTAITATFLTNAATSANAGPDRVVFDTAVLDGSASQGNIVSYAWTLTHRTNAAFNRTATGQRPDLTDLKPGFYDVTLTVTDALSQTRTASSLLAVAGPWDVSGDGKQGLAEVICILQRMTGLRP